MTSPPIEPLTREPLRTLCQECSSPVLVVAVRARSGEESIVVADAFEWEPRARCYVCSTVESRSRECPKCRGAGRLNGAPCLRCGGEGIATNTRANCNRCGGLGFVGTPRPDGHMLAIDVGWGDEAHVRVIGPLTTRERGEALYALHPCDNAVIMPGVPNADREAA